MLIWNYFPDRHDFVYICSIHWPTYTDEQLDWITGITDVEQWLLRYTGPKYQRWAWHLAENSYDISVAFKYDKHRTLFLLNYS